MLKDILIKEIERNPEQPRQHFEAEEIQQLADSLKAVGQISPITVRPKDGKYEIVEGERRWRAVKLLGEDSILAIVRNLDDESAFLVAVTENVQRADLNPIDEARALQRLIDQYGYSQTKVGETLGKSQQYVAGKLALLRLCPEVEALITTRAVSASAGRIIATVDNPESQVKLAKGIQDGMSVKELQTLVAELRECNAQNDAFAVEIGLMFEEVSKALIKVTDELKDSVLPPEQIAELIDGLNDFLSTLPMLTKIIDDEEIVAEVTESAKHILKNLPANE